MNLYDSILASLPLTAFKLNGAGTGYTDITNRAVALTPDPTLAFTSPIISGGVTKSLDAKNANRAFFAKGNVYRKGSEKASWSMEAWVSPRLITSGKLDIISNAIVITSPQDGLSIDSDFIHFRVEFNNSAVDLAWPMPDDTEVWHVVGTYTPGKVTLYINGEVVASSDITDAQIADGFKQADTSFYVGRSSETIAAAVDGIATYTRALGDAEIYRHFLAGRRVNSAATIASIFGGNSFDGSKRDVFAQKTWTSKVDWIQGVYTDVEFENGNLKPVEDPTNQTSLAGVWTGVYEASASAGPLYGVDVDWDGTGNFIVQASINDGSSWITLTNGGVVTGTFNWTPTNVVLIKITFTGGVVGDTSSIQSLRVVGYSSATVYGSDGSRRLTVGSTHTTWPESNQPIESNSSTGISITSGSVVLSNDAEVDDPRNVGSLEFWVRFTGAVASKYVFDVRPFGGTEYLWVTGASQFAFPSGTLYVNGVSVAINTFTPLPDVWYHLVYVFATPANRSINIGGAGSSQFSLVSVYPNQLTAAEAALAYLMYSDYPSTTLATNSNPITEGATPYKLYAYDWSISPTG